MRKLTKKVIEALEEGKNEAIGNTYVSDNTLYLFGNSIIKKEGDKTLVRLAGYNTRTTRERINGLQHVGYSVDVICKNGVPYINGNKMDTLAWYEVHKA